MFDFSFVFSSSCQWELLQCLLRCKADLHASSAAKREFFQFFKIYCALISLCSIFFLLSFCIALTLIELFHTETRDNYLSILSPMMINNTGSHVSSMRNVLIHYSSSRCRSYLRSLFRSLLFHLRLEKRRRRRRRKV